VRRPRDFGPLRRKRTRGSLSVILASRRSRSAGREGPVERSGDRAVVLAEAQQPIGELVERVEAVGAERLRWSSIWLSQEGVDREVDERQVLPGGLEPLEALGVEAVLQIRNLGLGLWRLRFPRQRVQTGGT
jgi:hypothetical protein